MCKLWSLVWTSAVTPIIGSKAIKGPAAKMMLELGLDVSGAARARRYASLVD